MIKNKTYLVIKNIFILQQNKIDSNKLNSIEIGYMLAAVFMELAALLTYNTRVELLNFNRKIYKSANYSG